MVAENRLCHPHWHFKLTAAKCWSFHWRTPETFDLPHRTAVAFCLIACRQIFKTTLVRYILITAIDSYLWEAFRAQLMCVHFPNILTHIHSLWLRSVKKLAHKRTYKSVMWQLILKRQQFLAMPVTNGLNFQVDPGTSIRSDCMAVCSSRSIPIDIINDCTLYGLTFLRFLVARRLQSPTEILDASALGGLALQCTFFCDVWQRHLRHSTSWIL